MAQQSFCKMILKLGAKIFFKWHSTTSSPIFFAILEVRIMVARFNCHVAVIFSFLLGRVRATIVIKSNNYFHKTFPQGPSQTFGVDEARSAIAKTQAAVRSGGMSLGGI